MRDARETCGRSGSHPCSHGGRSLVRLPGGNVRCGNVHRSWRINYSFISSSSSRVAYERCWGDNLATPQTQTALLCVCPPFRPNRRGRCSKSLRAANYQTTRLLTITERDESVASRGLRKRRPEYGELTRRPRVLGRGLRAAFGQRFRWLCGMGVGFKNVIKKPCHTLLRSVQRLAIIYDGRLICMQLDQCL